MKWLNPLAMVAMAIIITPAVLTAAPYITTLAVPPPGQYHIEQLWNVTLNNPDQDTYRVWLEGTITEAVKGKVFSAKTDSFDLEPTPARVLHYDLVAIGIKSPEYAPGYKEFAYRTGGLPEGDYTFTVKLQPNFGSKPIHFIVRPMGPPRLISPRDGDTIRPANPQFVWTPPSPAPRGRVTYELKLVEVLPGQTAEEAMRANPPWFEQKGITATSLTYPTSARQLEDMPPHKAYAWRVTATTGGGAGVASEVWSFAYARSGQQPDSATAFPSILELDIAEASFGRSRRNPEGFGAWFIPKKDVSPTLNDPSQDETPIGVLLMTREAGVVYLSVRGDTAFIRVGTADNRTLMSGRGKWTPKGSGREVLDVIPLCYAGGPEVVVNIERVHQDTPGHRRYCKNRLDISVRIEW